MKKHVLFAAAAALLTLGVSVPASAQTAPDAQASTPVRATAHFVPPLTNVGSAPSGTLQISQGASGTTNYVDGTITGLPANKLVVAVPYVDPYCTPVPGVTAFPTAPVYTDPTGKATFNHTTINPQGINPVGMFDATQTKSVSIRQVLVQGITIFPGLPPITVPNALYTEGCDKNPTLASMG